MDKLAEISKKLSLGSIERHIFLCADQTNPKCCLKEDSLVIWDYLKKRLDELGLTKQGGVFRTKANCLRLCYKGPVAVVYPEGVWYHSVTIPVMERIIEDHLVGGVPVREYIVPKLS